MLTEPDAQTPKCECPDTAIEDDIVQDGGCFPQAPVPESRTQSMTDGSAQDGTSPSSGDLRQPNCGIQFVCVDNPIISCDSIVTETQNFAAKDGDVVYCNVRICDRI